MWRVGCLSVILALVSSVAFAQGQGAKPVDPRVVAAHTQFGFNLFKQFVRTSGGKNVVMSPSSVAVALSMTYNGAGGTTKTAMARTLGYTSISLDEVNAGNRALMQSLAQPGPGVEISIANSLWGRAGVQFKPEFLNRNREFYQAEIAALQFNSPDAVDRINSWVSDKTRGKITRIIDRIDPQSVLYLVNAVYFNGKWTVPFDPKLTKPHDFTLGSGKVTKVPMMFREGDFECYKGQTFQLIKLNYGDNARLGMYVLLPAKESSPGELYKQLTPANWNEWIRQAKGRTTEVELRMPKFKAEYRTEAKGALSTLGMSVAFDPLRADFTAMAPIPPTPNVFIGEVVHKAVVEVDEQGTVAAAATSVGMRATAMPGPQVVKMVVDRPFMFAIRDDVTGTVLFLGAITEPKS